jgi:NADPH-dependent glutamate synthase beta subunit-like oxidoreductase/dihydroorotate dehydrogenase
MRYSEKDIQLPVKVAGVEFRNPFYVASGPTTMTVEQLIRIEETGWGGASLKLSFDPPAYINRHPRYGYWPDQGILSFTTERRMLLEESLRLVEEARKRTSRIILFSNFTYFGDRGLDGWVAMARAFEAAGAHVNEINMCCPNMSYNVELSQGEVGRGPKTGASLGQQMDIVKAIVAAIRQSTGIPLFVKLTPEGGRIAQVAKACYEAGADAVGTTANRLAIHHVDLDNPTRSPIALQEEISMQCMCSNWVHPLGLRDVYEMRTVNGPEVFITGTGGVSDWRSAAEMFLCGANLVGICAETLISGFGFLPRLVKEFKQWMDEHGFASVETLTGILPPAIRTAPQVTIYQGNARIRDNRLSAPCVRACPASVPAQAYISKVAEGEFEEAYQILAASTPLMYICALVCNHPCEEACTRARKDESLRIRDLKRFLVERAREEGWAVRSKPVRRNGKRVAIVGAGPSGLAAAALLAQAGYEVKVFEASSRAGGMLRWALPSFRCPQDVLDEEVRRIESLGVNFCFNRVLGADLRLEDLRREFDAVYVAVGAQQSVRLGIPGEDAQGVVPALDFLRSLASGERPAPGRRVAVIGGGFTAVDAARSALRLGAAQVFILYRRTREEMPASAEEIREAEEEGVRIMYLVAPREVLTREGRVAALALENQVLGGPDDSGRRRPVPVEGAVFRLEVDTVITALGQRVELPGETALVPGRLGTVPVGDDGNVGLEGVYAGGDAVLGASTVIEAIGTAKRAANGIDRFLRGSGAVVPALNGEAQVAVEEVLVRHGREPRKWRVPLDPAPAAQRAGSFDPYAPVLGEAEAVEEASRCLRCGCGEGCMICHDICKAFAYRKEETRVVLDEEKCLACGMCAWRCPNGNIEMIQTSALPI